MIDICWRGPIFPPLRRPSAAAPAPDPEILAKLDVSESETVVEIYARLMAHLVKDGLSGVVTSWIPPVVHVTETGNLVIQGKRVTDLEALTEMNIPRHEDVVEVDKAAIEALFSEG